MRALLIFLILALMTAALALVLFPIFARPKAQPRWVLLGADSLPLANEKVQGRCEGRAFSAKTDLNGGLDIDCPRLEDLEVEGFVLAYVSNHSGGRPARRFHFSRRGDYVFTFRNEDATLLNGVPVSTAIQTGADMVVHGPAKSRLVAKDLPVGIPSGRVSIRPTSLYWRLVRWNRSAIKENAEFEVVLKRLDKPLDRVYWMSYDGTKVRFH